MASSPNPSRPCILLVDDTPANIDVLVGLLQSDYELKIANRGAKALQICTQADRIDLILLDVMMPEMDGFTVCATLRARPESADIPIIFLTARTEIDSIIRGFEIGANDYVTKPFRPAELLARVRTHLTIRAQQREILDKNQELREMVRILCHDVANHFSTIMMSLELIQHDPSRDLNFFLPRMQSAVRNGIGLTSLVRDLRRSEEKTIKLTAVPLATAIDEALLLAEEKIRAKQIQVTTDVPAVDVWAEPSSLVSSVFGNIISNAIKFSHSGGTLDITGTADATSVTVRLRDTGVGMKPEDLESLFSVGRSRSHLGTAGETGTGFGMPLMRRFVRLYHGDVQVDSRDETHHPTDHGTEFVITLQRST